MIIRDRGNTLEFITQPDHAHLSRRVMEHATALRVHPRSASILLAVREHDNGWAEPDAAPAIDPVTGQPFDFVTAPAASRQAVWPRGVARVGEDPWAAALVAQHAITVYDRHRSDAEWAAFFLRMEALRGEWVRASAGILDDLLADYQFVRLGDLLSLAFCTGWTDEHRFGEWKVTHRDRRVHVTPWPFDVDSIPLEIRMRKLNGRRYPSDAALRDQLRTAPFTMLRGELTRAHP